MGKALIIKGADFSSVYVAKIDFGLEVPQILLNVDTINQATLSVETAGLDIYYTTDGTAPQVISSEKYSAPFSVGYSAKIKAISSNGTITSSLPKLTFDVYISEDDVITIAIDSSVSGTIRYTTDGTNPTSSSTEYSSAFVVTGGQCVKAAVYNGTTQESNVSVITLSES